MGCGAEILIDHSTAGRQQGLKLRCPDSDLRELLWGLRADLDVRPPEELRRTRNYFLPQPQSDLLTWLSGQTPDIREEPIQLRTQAGVLSNPSPFPLSLLGCQLSKDGRIYMSQTGLTWDQRQGVCTSGSLMELHT